MILINTCFLLSQLKQRWSILVTLDNYLQIVTLISPSIGLLSIRFTPIWIFSMNKLCMEVTLNAKYLGVKGNEIS